MNIKNTLIKLIFISVFILTIALSFNFNSVANISNAVYLDHINIAVKDLELAKNHYKEKLGFSIKSGRLHKNSILNAFAKFKSGSQLELITVSGQHDDLSKFYLNFINENQMGAGAFIALRVNDEKELDFINDYITSKKLSINFIKGSYSHIISFEKGTPTNPLFFIRYLSKVKDKQLHLNHPNTAQSLYAVWLPLNISSEYKKIGFKISSKVVLPVFNIDADVINLIDGKIYFVPTDLEKRILGVTILVKDIFKAKELIEKNTNIHFEVYKTDRGQSFVLSPDLTYGIWMEFLEK